MANPTLPTDVNLSTFPSQAGTAFTTNSGSHAVIRLADYSLWDTVSNAYVSNDSTNVPKPNCF